jgi:hypothetical protein
MVTSSAVVGSSAISSAGCRRSPWRSSRAGSCRPTSGAERHSAARSPDRGCRPAPAVRRRGRGAPCPAAEMEAQRLLDLEADGEAGVEAGHRLLEDHRHVLADDLAALALASGQQVAAVEGHAVGGDLAVQGSRPITASMATTCRSRTRRRWRGPRPHRRQRNAVDGAEGARRGCRIRREVADFEKRHGSALQLGVERVAQPVAHQVDGQHGDQDGRPGKVTTQGRAA